MEMTLPVVTILFVLSIEGPTSVHTAESVICGTPKIIPATSRVVNGHEARHGAWPWVVLLLELNVPVCGGAILNEHVIVTAAHCFDELASRDVRRWKVQIGKHHIDRYDYTERTFRIRKLVMHANYNGNTVSNDIALLELTHKITYTDYAMPVCLPGLGQTLHAGKKCYLAGWGDTLGTGNGCVLNQVALPIISDNICSRPDWYGSEFIRTTMLCAGYAAGMKDACSGDSGSPLVCKHGTQWYIQGITSWGYGCAEPKWPGLYTEVSKYTSWIREKAKHLGYQVA